MNRKKLEQLLALLKWAQNAFAHNSEVLKASVILEEKCEEEFDKLSMAKEETPDDQEDHEDRKGGHKNQFALPKEVYDYSHALLLFTDGACRGNPGPGSWALMAQAYQLEGVFEEVIFEASGVDVPTTNNRMELTAAIQGLRLAKDHLNERGVALNIPVLLFSDSRYLLDGLEKWLLGWKARGWLKADNKPPENLDLWQELDELKTHFAQLKFYWVKGHAGHPQNEHVDELANFALDEAGY